MNLLLWSSIREYIYVEIKAALARHDADRPPLQIERENIARLEAHSTRMETDIRSQLSEESEHG